MDRDWLKIVAEQHDTWVEIVKGFGETNYHEDIVQEAYIALSKYATPEKIIKNGKVSRGYMFFTLRSLYYQYYNKKKKIQKVSIDDDQTFLQLPYQDGMEEQQAFHRLCLLVDEVSNNWNWYDKKMWKLYSQTDMSIRKLASETRISWVSIFNTLKNLKQDIRLKLQEDFEDLKNEDYERI
jgi:DNA-directed RNA polymerase specialized sigma24 family protein